MPQQSAYEQLQQIGQDTKNKLADTFSSGPVKRTVSGWYQQGKQAVQQAEDKIKQALPKAAPAKPTPAAKPSSFKKGGMVQKTGLAKVHRGEKVLTVSQTKAAKKKGK